MKNFNYKKSLGQNFLIDNNIVNKIVESISPLKDDLIIEIGPGSGALTKKLVNKNCDVLCFEIDKRLEEELKKIKCDNLKILFENFLDVDLEKHTKAYKNIYFIGNLPYYITTPIIMKIIYSNININEMVFMVQKEVGDRFCALNNTKMYNSLTVFLNYYFEIKKIIKVSKNCFVPSPKIDSVVLKFYKRKEKMKVNNEEHLFELIRDSFKYKRKNLRNNLKEYDLIKVEKCLKILKKDLTYRAESLTIEEFVEISNYLN